MARRSRCRGRLASVDKPKATMIGTPMATSVATPITRNSTRLIVPSLKFLPLKAEFLLSDSRK